MIYFADGMLMIAKSENIKVRAMVKIEETLRSSKMKRKKKKARIFVFARKPNIY